MSRLRIPTRPRRTLERNGRRPSFDPPTPIKITRRPKPPVSPFRAECWLARFDPGVKCEGLPVRCHLVKEQWLRRFLGLELDEAWHPDFWVWGCNGIATSHGGHHLRLDRGHIRLRRSDLPHRIEARARALLADGDGRLAAKLEREYGRLPLIGRAA